MTDGTVMNSKEQEGIVYYLGQCDNGYQIVEHLGSDSKGDGACVFHVSEEGISDGDGFPTRYDESYMEIGTGVHRRVISEFHAVGEALLRIGNEVVHPLQREIHIGDYIYWRGTYLKVVNILSDNVVVRSFCYDTYDLDIDVSNVSLSDLDISVDDLKDDGILITGEMYDRALAISRYAVQQITGYLKSLLQPMKTVVYLHGFGSSGLSGTVSFLMKKMPECRVIAPDIPIDPYKALPFLKDYCEANHADLIIGTSMGAMYAMQLKGYKRICMNPALYMSQLKDILKVGTFDYFQPTAEGNVRYTITERTIRHYEEIEATLFDGITEEDQSSCFGFFADGDKTVNCKEEFSAHFNNVMDFHGEHRMSNSVLREVIIPFANQLLKGQQ